MPEWRRQVGSHFETAGHEDLTRSSVIPWEQHDRELSYVASGRQSLDVVARQIRRLGHRRILMPAHHCESMGAPFRRHGLELELVPVDERLHVQSQALFDHVREPAHDVVLSATYFGQRTPAALSAVYAQLVRDGFTIVADESHHPFRPVPSEQAHVAVASLRKLLPLASGAYLRGWRIPPGATHPPEAGAVSLMWTAMDEKAASLTGAADSDYRVTFARAERLLITSQTPRAMDDTSLAVMRCLDYQRMAARRRHNERELTEVLGRYGIAPLTHFIEDDVPAFVVICVRDAGDLQGRLAAEGYFCPRHWERPPYLSDSMPWRHDLVSLPVDHRYGVDDMHAFGHAVGTAVA